MNIYLVEKVVFHAFYASAIVAASFVTGWLVLEMNRFTARPGAKWFEAPIGAATIVVFNVIIGICLVAGREDINDRRNEHLCLPKK